ncbi:ATP phosphoribosyltransferase regulatory subunit [Allohahella marinimesophila]|uniref:ATP phosphoribosyltransferase regulatory subunit n=1 Tax=Allohahella marinimesophila TaxID=1054972 RepID=A0ABP7NJV0_9GAMM
MFEPSETLAASGKWMLPDGVEDLLPHQAASIERLRRAVLDLYASWGYQLVVPPMIEFLDSLLTGVGSDLELQTFKVTDQLSGRMLGIRADMTPQVARIDAHQSMAGGVDSSNQRNRYCYVGSVLKTRMESVLATRTPTQSGCELYGEASIAGDIEVLSMMLEVLDRAGLPSVHVDLAHVGFIRKVMQLAGFDPKMDSKLLDVLNRRAVAELDVIATAASDPQLAALIKALPSLGGPASVLEDARELCHFDHELLAAISEIETLGQAVTSRYPSANIRYDLCELRGLNYHTGLMFAAYTGDYGQAIGYGGRYDNIGLAFGSRRPATGFSIDLKVLHKLAVGHVPSERSAILAPADDSPSLWQYIHTLRKTEKVIQLLPGQGATDYATVCDRQIVAADEPDKWQLMPLLAL